ncbi:receptor-like protein 7 [Ziziphus jujuba]|uniref:Receptor-like protein 7 n=1 Tax=Ziziphus jujuba TaxID=326968 RepID=A0A6P3ZBC0_ZIZJJ|nr:receptor-like protein 7 [Ziziphus jujuba]
MPLCHDYERTALLSFKASFITLKSASHNPFAYPKLASWNTNGENATGNCCSWDGVECDQNTGHVIGLDLSSSFLYGSINSTSQLFNLSQLQSLNLADNDFNFSYIPTRIGQLSRLVYLNLSASMFSGQIPFEISQLSNLLYLDLSLSSGEEKLLELKKPGLRGLVHNLTSLQHLDLSYVEINSVVPESLGNLSSLRYIDLTRCGMHGNFPNKIFELPNLEFLNVRFNGNLSGNLPEFHSGSPLKSLRLGNTRFFGGLPSSISNLDSLTELRIRGCNFSGSIPSSIGNLTKLTYLDLANNSWHGQIPSSLQNLTQLSYLQLSYNAFRGQILPTLSWIGKLSKLILLDLTKTNLTGSIPSSFSNLTQLSNFRLAYNHLTGQVPLWLMNFTQLTDLYLSQNFLTGTLQLETFINHASLTILRLSHNQLTLVSKTNSNTTLGKLEGLELASCNLNRLPDFLNFRNKLECLIYQKTIFTEQFPN